MRLVGLVPVLGVLLAGCGGGSTQAEPKPLLPVSASPSPTAVALEVPPSARAATPQGAAAFVRHYYEQVRLGLVDGSSAGVRALSAPQCESCLAIAGGLDAEAKTGNKYSGGEITGFVAEGIEDSPGTVTVNVVLTSADYTVTKPSGATKTQSGARGTRLEVQVRRSGNGWLVQRITVLGTGR